MAFALQKNKDLLRPFFCLAIRRFFLLCKKPPYRPPVRKGKSPAPLRRPRPSPPALASTPARKKAACTICPLLHPFPPRPFRSAALRPSAASGRPSSLPSAPHTLIFSITWIFFPLKEFSFLETIRFLCNYVSVVVFYLNFFRRHAMKSLLCFFLGLAFLPVPASAIEHLPPPLTPFK